MPFQPDDQVRMTRNRSFPTLSGKRQSEGLTVVEVEGSIVRCSFVEAGLKHVRVFEADQLEAVP